MASLIQNIPLIGKEIPWLQTLRDSGLQAFEKSGVPTPKAEAWKYTKPRDLNADDFVMQTSSATGASPLELPFPCYQIHFENGTFNPEISDLPQGVEVLPLIEAVLLKGDTRQYLGKLIEVERHPFAALNTYYLNEGLYIRVEKNVELKKPLMLINHTVSGAQNLFFNLRNLIILEEGAAADFIEYYHYSGEVKSRYFANVVNEIFVGRKARFNHYKFQNEAFKANHVALSNVEVKADGAYNSFCLQKGANIGRNETRVFLRENNAHTNVDAAYIMNGWATLDTTTDVEHLAPCTFSHQLVKGVVGGDARGVFQGKIHIAKDAVKTEGFQLHKALLLSDTAEIDVKPELEIFADDVKCSHGAASGELDENALFYMQSRGIGLEEAKQILIDAYLDDVISKISFEAIRDWFKDLAAQTKV